MKCNEVRIVISAGYSSKTGGKHSIKVMAYPKEGGSQVVMHARNVPNEATTANQSEYSALLCALTYLKGLLDRMDGRRFGVPVTIYSKNQVLVYQVNGVDKVKAEGLVQYNEMAVQMLGLVGATLQHASKAQIEASL